MTARGLGRIAGQARPPATGAQGGDGHHVRRSDADAQRLQPQRRGLSLGWPEGITPGARAMHQL